MKLITLMENTAMREDLCAEHGLSLYIEVCGRKILFDAGQTSAFYENARRLGVYPEDIDICILSHGHYDHGGGLKRFLEVNVHAPVYMNRRAFEPHYSGPERYIGLDETLADSGRIVLTDDEYELGGGMRLVTCNGMQAPYPDSGGGLLKKQGDEFLADGFEHEQYLLIEKNGRRIAVSGCSHKGIMNILTWLRPDVLIGGLHFSKLDPQGDGREMLDCAAEMIRNMNVEVYTGHCTGLTQYEYLKDRLGERIRYIAAGSVLEI